MQISSNIILAEVPQENYHNPAIKLNMTRMAWSAKYNIACWLCATGQINQSIQLYLTYLDTRGWQNVLIDESPASPRSPLLLSGMAEIPILGPIIEMQITAVGVTPSMQISVEELFVQRVAEPVEQASQNNNSSNVA